MSLNFFGNDIGEEGARSVARRIPAGLTSLKLEFELCYIEDGGALAVAESIPAGLSSLSICFTNCGIGEQGRRSVIDRVPAIFRSNIIFHEDEEETD